MPDAPPPLEMSDDEFIRVRDYLIANKSASEAEINQRLLTELLESSRRIETLLETIRVDLRRGPAGFRSGN